MAVETNGRTQERQDPRTFTEVFDGICANVRRAIRGKDDVIALVVTCMVARGHLLLEDVPGVGKTSLSKALARSIDADFRRVQFTPDLLPSDVLGTSVWSQADGTFEAGIYVPAYIRRYPFVFANDESNKQMVLCIDRAAHFVSDSDYDMAFFEADGQPTEYTKNCIEFCNNFEVERQRTASFVQLLKDLDLFELKTATFQPVNPDGTQGEPQKIAEYFGVSEEKLNALTAEKFLELRDNGALGQIYAHLHSLVGWDRLVALAMQRAGQQQATLNS